MMICPNCRKTYDQLLDEDNLEQDDAFETPNGWSLCEPCNYFLEDETSVLIRANLIKAEQDGIAPFPKWYFEILQMEQEEWIQDYGRYQDYIRLWYQKHKKDDWIRIKIL